MTFQAILPKFLKGAKIRKTSWTKQYVFINNKNVIVDENNNVCHLQGHNLVEDGWEIYDDREYFDFNKALELMEEGKKVRRKDRHDIDGIKFVYLNGGSHYTTDRGIVISLNRPDIMAQDWYLVEEE